MCPEFGPVRFGSVVNRGEGRGGGRAGADPADGGQDTDCGPGTVRGAGLVKSETPKGKRPEESPRKFPRVSTKEASVP